MHTHGDRVSKMSGERTNMLPGQIFIYMYIEVYIEDIRDSLPIPIYRAAQKWHRFCMP